MDAIDIRDRIRLDTDAATLSSAMFKKQAPFKPAETRYAEASCNMVDNGSKLSVPLAGYPCAELRTTINAHVSKPHYLSVVSIFSPELCHPALLTIMLASVLSFSPDQATAVSDYCHAHSESMLSPIMHLIRLPIC